MCAAYPSSSDIPDTGHKDLPSSHHSPVDTSADDSGASPVGMIPPPYGSLPPPVSKSRSLDSGVARRAHPFASPNHVVFYQDLVGQVVTELRRANEQHSRLGDAGPSTQQQQQQPDLPMVQDVRGAWFESMGEIGRALGRSTPLAPFHPDLATETAAGLNDIIARQNAALHGSRSQMLELQDSVKHIAELNAENEREVALLREEIRQLKAATAAAKGGKGKERARDDEDMDVDRATPPGAN